MSNLWSKFVLAQRYTNELFAQIKEEFKFYQDYQLHSLAESRVKRMDKLYEDIDITFHYDEWLLFCFIDLILVILFIFYFFWI